LQQSGNDILLAFTHWFSFSSSHKNQPPVFSILPQLTVFLQTFFHRLKQAMNHIYDYNIKQADTLKKVSACFVFTACCLSLS
ncbi:MAG: hypothetical protein MR503_02830, partial [Oscillospiraceae bacterium]|nr:hypothetical protein [Oscillospiraceae bacterium]